MGLSEWLGIGVAKLSDGREVTVGSLTVATPISSGNCWSYPELGCV
jgi:hypothetical protein